MSDQSLADKFVIGLAELKRVCEIPNDHPDRYAIWKLRNAAETAIANGLQTAGEIIEAVHSLKRSRDSISEIQK